MDYNKTSRTLAGIFLTVLCVALLAVFTSRTNGPVPKAEETFDKAMLHAEIRAYILENPDIIFEAAARAISPWSNFWIIAADIAAKPLRKWKCC